jgi:cell division protein FtsI/penicillin-binding protein 2
MRRVRLGSLLVVLALLAAGCTGSDDESAAQDAADLLAQRLQQHTLTGAPLLEVAAAKSFEDQVAGLKGYDVQVAASDVRTDGDAGTAHLRWTWQLGAQEWTYETTTDLVKTDDGWKVGWRSDTLAPDLAEDERLEVSRTAAKRADILGPGGTPIVTQRRVFRYGLDKARIPAADVPTAARRVASAVGVDADRFVKEAKGAGPKQFVEAIVLRPADAHRSVGSDFTSLPGALVLHDAMPLAPSRDFAAALLGQVGAATAEVVENSEGRVQPGDEVGLSGLQARYDEQLGGTPTTEVRAVTVTCAEAGECTPTDTERVLASWAGVPGRPLSLTLDIGLQAKAEKILTGSAPAGGRSPAAAIVAIRPSTGDVLVAANGPGSGGQDVATYGRYAPGSTFKVVSSLALLRAGVKPETVVSCPGTVAVDGRRFKNYDDYPASALGDVPFRTAIANSCNTAVIGQRERLGRDDLADAAAALGLGVDHDLGFPAYFGQVPPPAGETEKAADLIGQGKVLASPMAMATVAASIAAGQVVVPHLVDGVAPTADPRKPLTAAEARQLRDLMRAVVTEGSGRFLADLPGEVGAKTGTAEYGPPRADGTLATHTWMIATQGDLAVAVFVETGESGSQTAGPLLEQFLSS